MWLILKGKQNNPEGEMGLVAIYFEFIFRGGFGPLDQFQGQIPLLKNKP